MGTDQERCTKKGVLGNRRGVDFAIVWFAIS